MNCKCGREANHRGRCWVRRGLRGPADSGKKSAGGGGAKARPTSEIFFERRKRRNACGYGGIVRRNLGRAAA